MSDISTIRPVPKLADLNAVAESYDNFILQFGRAESIAVESIVWNGGGAYTGWLGAESLVTVVSNSLDDASGQGGALTVRLIGQGANGIEKREDIVLDGTTEVDSTGLFKIIYGMLIRTTEDDDIFTGPNHGEIQVYEKGTSANVMAIVKPANGSALMCIYRIPADKYGEVDHLDVYPVAAQPIVLAVNIRPSPGLAWLKVGEADFDQTTLNFILARPVFLPPGADIVLSADPSTPTNVGALFEIKLFDVDIT